MKPISQLLTILLLLSFTSLSAQSNKLGLISATNEFNDFYTPQYYLASEGDPFIIEINKIVNYARKISFQHPLQNSEGVIPEYSVPTMGEFGAGKGPTGTEQHHPAIDMHVENRETNVTLYAAYDGYVEVFYDSPKYRHYLTLTKNIEDSSGNILGKMVTIYAHIDLDLDSENNILPNATNVNKGDIISKNLYSGTIGGPHLHFEIRYYRPTDVGNEEFYSFVGPIGSDVYTEPSAGIWSYGYWKKESGYGYADPKNHWQDSKTNVSDKLLEIPDDFTLSQNYPNPFNPSTTIEYGLKTDSNVQLTVYNILGQRVATLVNERQNAGNYSLHFDASSLSSGTYIYKITATPTGSATENFVSVKKLLLMK